MLHIINETANTSGLTFKSSDTSQSWRANMESTKFNIAPRGYGRSSFRFVESIQMGRLPVWVYDDIPWIPYEGTNISVLTYGFAGGINEYNNHTKLSKTIYAIGNLTSIEYTSKLLQLKKVRKYFTYAGVFEQINLFLIDPFGSNGGALRCIKHPKTERCCG